jgi:hypothetical protein
MGVIRRLPLLLLAAVILSLISTSARADIYVAQQPLDFQSTNGHPDTIGSGTWQYMYSNTMNPTLGTTGLMVWDSGQVLYTPSIGHGYPDIGFTGGYLTMVPEVGTDLATRYAVMRWTSGVAGAVDVTGLWTHYWNNGDGIDIAIYSDGVQKFSTLLQSGSSSFDFDALVGISSTIDFVVGPGALGDGNWDRAKIEAQISMVPIPGAVVLGSLGLSFAGCILRRMTH